VAITLSQSSRDVIACHDRLVLHATIVTVLLLAAIGCSGATAATSPPPSRGAPSGPVVPVPADLWRPPAGTTPAVGTYAYVETDPDFSPGTKYPRTIVPATGTFAVSAVGGTLTIVSRDTAAPFELRGAFTTMLGHVQLEEGYYRDLRDPAHADPLKGSLEVSLNARGCGSTTGWFVVDHVFYFNGRLTTLDLRFEQRCPGFPAPMHGQIHWTENLT
jgi:hypothetical protein